MIWIHAGNKVRFEQDYRKLAVLLGLPGHDDMKMDIRPVVKAWLEGPLSGNWVLILDNADNILDFYPETHVKGARSDDYRGGGLAQFVPLGSKGTVIVTTRDYSVAEQLSDMNILPKEKMNPHEAIQLFKNRYPNVGKDEKSVNLLLEELDYLPLAIVQAAAYLRQNRLLRPSGYLQQFKATKRGQREFLSKPFLDLRRDSGSAGVETLLATFAITFEQVQSQAPLAGSFLEIIACIDRQGIPSNIFHESLPESIHENEAGEALGKLIDFALITEGSIDECLAFVMHALVHVSLQEFISSKGKMEGALQKTAEVLLKILPSGSYETWSVSRPYSYIIFYLDI